MKTLLLSLALLLVSTAASAAAPAPASILDTEAFWAISSDKGPPVLESHGPTVNSIDEGFLWQQAMAFSASVPAENASDLVADTEQAD